MATPYTHLLLNKLVLTAEFMAGCIVLAAVFSGTLATAQVASPDSHLKALASLLTKLHQPSKVWAVQEGNRCNGRALPLQAENEHHYFECLVKSGSDGKRKKIGTWHKKSCGTDRIFSPTEKTCVDVEKGTKKSIRRFPGPGICTTMPQMAVCGHGPAPPVIPVPCPHATGGAVACPGCPCSWMLDPHAIDPNTPHGYLQCQPAFPGIYCGVWTPMPCAPGTRFDLNVQVCVHDECHGPSCGGCGPGGCGGYRLK